MKHILRLLAGQCRLTDHSVPRFDRSNVRRIVRLVALMMSLHTLSWGQCFNPSTVSLGYTTAPVSNSPATQAVGDFNGDGKPDIALLNFSSNNVGILLNTGNGTFGPITNYPVGSQPRSITVGDFNGDGKSDVAIANTGSGNVSVLLNTGGGSFGGATNFTVGTTPNSIAVGDFNSDGKPDLVTANYTDKTVSVLLNAGGGGFSGAANFPTGESPSKLIVSDFNSDGKLDLAILSNFSFSSFVSILLGNGIGGLGTATFINGGSVYVDIATGDFNGDGKPDLAVVSQMTNNVSILLSNGNGGFGMAPNVAVGSSPLSLVVGDFNGDGKSDLAVTREGANVVSVFLGNGNGSFGAKTDFAVGASPYNTTTGDFNGDGKLDLSVTNGNDATVSILLGKGDGNFGMAGSILQPISVVVADFNRDGKPDMAVASFNSNNVSVLLNNGSGGFGAVTSFAVGTNPTSIAVGDLNGDGRPDIVITNAGSNNVSVMLGNGSGGFGMAPNVAVGEFPQSIAVIDYNGDGKLDFVTANIGLNISTSPPDNIHTISVALGNGSGGFGAATNFDDGIPYTSVTTGDFDGDGKPDLVFGTPSTKYSANVQLSKTSTTNHLILPYTPTAITVNDFNGDGKLDLATANSGGNNVSVLLGDGTGKFGTPINYAAGAAPYSIAVSDFTSDGKLDLAVTNSTSDKVSVLPGNGSGGFGAAASFPVGDNPVSAAVGDFNGDGKPDLVTANYNSNDATVLFNCTNTGPANTAPTVANAIPNQTGTVGTAFSYVIPANTFIDAQTPNGLALSASGLPAGLNFTGSTISGTPSASGVATVTITATDPGNLAVSTTFVLTVTGTATPPIPPGSLTITSFTCFSTAGALSSVNFVVGYGGGTFTPALPNLFINGITVTGQLGTPYTFGFDANQSFLPVQDQASRSTYFVWNFRAACAGGVTPPVAMAPVAPALSNQTATQNAFFSYVVPAFTGTAPIAYATTGLPAGLSFNAASRTISGTPTGTGVSTVMITGSNSAGSGSGTFTITVNAVAVPPSTPGSLTITNFTCNYTAGALSSVNFVVGYGGGTFTPALPNLFINGVTITGQLGQTYAFGFDANQSLLPIQDQATRSTYFVWNFRQACPASGVRIGVEPVAAWQAQLLGNPVKEQVVVAVSGAQGQSLQLELTDMGGHVVSTRQIQPGTDQHQEVFDVQRQAGGLLLLQVVGNDHRQTLKILKQ